MKSLPTKVDKNTLDNLITESFLYQRFQLCLLNQFKWTGPEELNIEERHIERYLFNWGKAMFFEDKELGFMVLPAHGIGEINVHGEHLRWRASGVGYYKDYSIDDMVLMENNKLRLPSHTALIYFVQQLYDLKRTMDINVKQLRLQSIFTATDRNLLTVKKIIDELEQNNWAIITDSTMNLEEIVKAVVTGVKPLTAELTDRYNAVMNEALTYFGINNSNTDKRERLISAEVNSNNQFIDSCAQMFLESRERACEEINKKFGLNWKVELRNKPEVVNNTEGVNNDKSVTKPNT